jgi:hypothetical protein
MRLARLALRKAPSAACDRHRLFRPVPRAEAGGWGKVGQRLAEGTKLGIIRAGGPVTDRMPGAVNGTATIARPVAPQG